jgi:acetyltransferase-like isoleucine patch superfamily enzyme
MDTTSSLVDTLIADAPGEFELMVVTHLPGQAGMVARHRYWRTRLRHLGASAMIDTGVSFQNPQYISIGDRTWIDKNVMILAGRDTSTRDKRMFENPLFHGEPGVVSIGSHGHVGPGCIVSGIEAGVEIGDRCAIAAHGKIYAFSHHYRPSTDERADWRPVVSPMVPQEHQHLIQGPVSIGSNTALGLNVVVMPGAGIPEDCFVATGSVVMPGCYRSNSVLAGHPACVVGHRYANHEPD